MNPQDGSFIPVQATPADGHYVFHLYVTGMTPRSTEAITRIKDICENHLQGNYELIVIDIYQQPHLASLDQIIATPTLIKKNPAPLRRFIGNLASLDQTHLGLGLCQG